MMKETRTKSKSAGVKYQKSGVESAVAAAVAATNQRRQWARLPNYLFLPFICLLDGRKKVEAISALTFFLLFLLFLLFLFFFLHLFVGLKFHVDGTFRSFLFRRRFLLKLPASKQQEMLLMLLSLLLDVV